MSNITVAWQMMTVAVVPALRISIESVETLRNIAVNLLGEEDFHGMLIRCDSSDNRP
jgi:hypothetical protein